MTSVPAPRLHFDYPSSDDIDADLQVIDNDIKHGFTPTRHCTSNSVSGLHASNTATRASDPGAEIGGSAMYTNGGGSGGDTGGTHTHPLRYILPTLF